MILSPHWLRIEEKLAFKPNAKLSTTHHAEGNSMASPTQTIVSKGLSNSLIAEDLLKILRNLIPLQNLLPIPVHVMVDPQSQKVILKFSPLTFLSFQEYYSPIPSRITLIPK